MVRFFHRAQGAKRFGVSFFILIFVAGIFLSMGSGQKAFGMDVSSEPAWYEGNGIVAHAAGAIDGAIYTNSIEAMELNYSKGARVFEVDMIFSSDCKLVCRHDWTSGVYSSFKQVYNKFEPIMSVEQFKNTLIMKKYQPMTAERLVQFMKDHPDTYVVTDFKHQNSFVFRSSVRAFFQEVKAVDPAMVSRVIWQIYSKENLGDLNKVFKVNPENVILCLYMKPFKYSSQEIMAWMLANQVKVLGLSESYYNRDRSIAKMLLDHDIKTYLFTINKYQNYKSLRLNYVFGIYTDTLIGVTPPPTPTPIPTPLPTVDPLNPLNPLNPLDPNNPGNPTDPVNPTAPVSPTTPVVPTTP